MGVVLPRWTAERVLLAAIARSGVRPRRAGAAVGSVGTISAVQSAEPETSGPSRRQVFIGKVGLAESYRPRTSHYRSLESIIESMINILDDPVSATIAATRVRC